LPGTKRKKSEDSGTERSGACRVKTFGGGLGKGGKNLHQRTDVRTDSQTGEKKVYRKILEAQREGGGQKKRERPEKRNAN